VNVPDTVATVDLVLRADSTASSRFAFVLVTVRPYREADVTRSSLSIAFNPVGTTRSFGTSCAVHRGVTLQVSAARLSELELRLTGGRPVRIVVRDAAWHPLREWVFWETTKA
jgi:hypothetical protein